MYYTTQDQRGNYRVGNNFLVDLENGRTSFDIESIFASNSTVRIKDDNGTVTLSPGQIAMDNIYIQGNTIEATRSALDFNSAGTIQFQDNVTMPSATMTGNFTIGGSLNTCLLYTSPSPRDSSPSRMPSSA